MQTNVKILDSPHGLLLSPCSDKIRRGITSSDLWHFIVKKPHCYVSGKYFSLKFTVQFIREQWSTDVRVSGIPFHFIKRCIQSCATCSGIGPFWDEVVKVPLEKLQDTLNNICAKHIVVRRIRSKRETTFTLVTYYYCHRGGKQKIRRDKEKMNSTRREKKSYKCDCEFLLKTMVPSMNTKSCIKITMQVTAEIHVHSKHSGHHPGSEGDKYFLPVHDLVLSFATENLKMIVSPSTVDVASLKKQRSLKIL